MFFVCPGMRICFQESTCPTAECARCVVTMLQAVTMEQSPAAAAKCSLKGPLQVGVRRKHSGGMRKIIHPLI